MHPQKQFLLILYASFISLHYFWGANIFSNLTMSFQMKIILLISILITAFSFHVNSQVVINEVVSSNHTGISDEDGDTPDWIELFNKGNKTVNLDGYLLNDRWHTNNAWEFPEVKIAPNAHLLVFASGKDRKRVDYNYHTIITQGDHWQYFVTDNQLPEGEWRLPGFDASAWQSGPSGFGYGDNDDNTVIQPLLSIYIRKEFTIDNLSDLQEILLHVDYDDAFIAFINGVPVAQGNVYLPDNNNFDNVEVTGLREATIYRGGYPEAFSIAPDSVPLFEGTNIIAIQGYNINAASSDFSLIPFLTLGSKQYSFTETSEYVRISERSGLHTNFRLDREGEPLMLFNPIGEAIDSIKIEPLHPDVSYGRYPDGAEDWFFFMNPTPAAPNANPVNEIISDTVFFSIPAGFYQQQFELKLEVKSPGVQIRYTTNGSEPTASSALYRNPLYLRSTTTIRAAAFRNDVRDRDIFSATYFIDKSHSLPVISILGNPKDFFDYHEGIFVEGPNAQQQDPKYGANYWMDWEKPVHFELFDEDEQLQLSQMAGVKIFGGWSRMSAQKSMSVFARNIYRNNRFNYQIFKDRDFDVIKTFVLRNSGNDWHYTMLRDGYVSEVVKDLNIDRLAYQPAVIYINGDYWGILNIREKTNEHYLNNNHGVNPDKVNRLTSNSSVIEGTNEGYNEIIRFIQNNTLENKEDYNFVAEKIDIEQFIDYQLIQIYVNNRDWPGNNIKYWNTTSDYSQWRWILYDTDFGLGLYNDRGFEENGIIFATQDQHNNWPNPAWSTLLLRRLLTNDDFKHHFINRMADLTNTTFKPHIMNAKLDSVAAIIDPEIGAHQTRWWRSYSQWNSRIQVIRHFNNQRPGYVRQHFTRYFNLDKTCSVLLDVSNPNAGKIKVSTIIPDEYPFNGTYFSNVPIGFEAIPMPGYRFVRWGNASTSKNRRINLTLTGTTSLLAIFEPIQEYETNIVINEINYRSSETNNSGDWVELYNAGEQSIDMSFWRIRDDGEPNLYVFPADLILYPGEYLVISSDLERFKHQYPNVKNVIGSMNFGFSSKGETIFLLDRQFNIINSVRYETQNPWPLEPLTTNSTLELTNPYANNTHYANWQAGPDGGTPGKQNSVYKPETNETSVSDTQIHIQKAFCFPSPFTQFTTLGFFSPRNKPYSIQIIDTRGNVIETIRGNATFEGTQHIDIFTNSEKYKSGIYFVNVITQNRSESIKVIKQ